METILIIACIFAFGFGCGVAAVILINKSIGEYKL